MTNSQDLNCVTAPYSENGKTLFRAECREKVDEDAKARQRAKEDFAKQLLVLIGTLVTAVSSFYFGTRAVATQADTRASGTLGSIDPSTAPAGSGPIQFKLYGNDLDLVRQVKLVSGSDELIGTEVSSNADIVNFTASFAKVEKEGQWDVLATDANQRVSKLQGAVKVTEVPQATITTMDNPPQDSKTNQSGSSDVGEPDVVHVIQKGSAKTASGDEGAKLGVNPCRGRIGTRQHITQREDWFILRILFLGEGNPVTVWRCES